MIPVTHDSGAAKVDGLVPESYRYHDVNSAVGESSLCTFIMGLERRRKAT